MFFMKKWASSIPPVPSPYRLPDLANTRHHVGFKVVLILRIEEAEEKCHQLPEREIKIIKLKLSSIGNLWPRIRLAGSRKARDNTIT